MARFIDADKIELEPTNSMMNGVLILGGQPGKTFSVLKAMLKAMINNQPTVDAVEVVRCKDCCWFRKREGSICVNPKCVKSWYGCPVPAEHFCSYGERRG